MTQKVADDYVKTIHVCTHCGDVCNFGNKFCKNCTYAAGRREMCEFNKKLIPNWKCKLCGIVNDAK